MTSFGYGEPVIDLDGALAQTGRDRDAILRTVRALATAAIDLDMVIGRGALGREAGDETASTLDSLAHDIMITALAAAPVEMIGTDREPVPTCLEKSGPLAVAIDPLDGLSNVDSNFPVGTIFSLLPMTDERDAALLQPGSRQLAAGFVIYGPQTCLVLTAGAGTDIYTLDRRERTFIRTRTGVRLPADSRDYAIEASNYRHWDASIQAYVDDNVAGDDQPRGKDFAMCWTGSLVADVFRILIRGGVYLNPGDRRPGFEKGRLRLIHEAAPIAMLVEQAGGLAIDGEDRILDIRPQDHDQRVPLIVGSERPVERVRAFHDGTLPLGERSPLFGRRGLFRH